MTWEMKTLAQTENKDVLSPICVLMHYPIGTQITTCIIIGVCQIKLILHTDFEGNRLPKADLDC